MYIYTYKSICLDIYNKSCSIKHWYGLKALQIIIFRIIIKNENYDIFKYAYEMNKNYLHRVKNSELFAGSSLYW